MNDYPDGQGKEKDSRYLSATRRGAQLKNSLVVVAYAGFSAALLLSLKYAISGQYWNLNLYLLALQVCLSLNGLPKLTFLIRIVRMCCRRNMVIEIVRISERVRGAKATKSDDMYVLRTS